MWESIIGQDDAILRLKKSMESGSLAHAYLLVGPAGVGKTMSALTLASALVCEEGGCGGCASCSKVGTKTHPDVEIVEPESNGIVIGQMRRIGHAIQLKPFESNYKIYIVRHVESMNQEAANAFLKTLEEPPPYVVFILTALNLDGVIATIVSRCQVIAFRAVSDDIVVDMLDRRFGLDAKKAKLVARLSGGSLKRAFEIAAAPEALSMRDELLATLSSITSKDYLAWIGLKDLIVTRAKVKETSQYQENLVEVFTILASWYRDALVLKENGSPTILFNLDHQEELDCFAAERDADRLMSGLIAIEEAKRVLRSNVNKDLLLENMVLNLSGE